MKVIKIFFASSEELENDRNAFGNLIRRLNKVYEKRGITLELFEWEDYDAAYNNVRKQEEYNEQVRCSDMFLAVFHKIAGKFTIEEFDIAVEECRKKALPKTYVYCKDVENGEAESLELTEFKQRLIDEMGHYWCRYSNKDTMQLNFIMQLQMVEASLKNSLKVDDGNVTLEGMPVAKMSNLSFAAQNQEFQSNKNRIQQLSDIIEKGWLRVEKYPEDSDFKQELQKHLDEYWALKKSFDEYQKTLLDAALRVAQLQSRQTNERIRRAIDAFNCGKIHEANIILEQAESDGVNALDDYLKCKQVTEQKRQNVFLSIQEILFKTKIVKADFSIDVNERVNKIDALYALAQQMAQQVNYDESQYIELLNDYAEFLDEYAKYDKALLCLEKVLAMRKKSVGHEHNNIANTYSSIAYVYVSMREFEKALDYLNKALQLRERSLGEAHYDTATNLGDIALVLKDQGYFEQALDYSLRSVRIIEELKGDNSEEVACAYSNLSVIYDRQNDLSNALNYELKSLNIRKSIFGEEHIETAYSYNNIGVIYARWPNHEKSMQYYLKALSIRKKILGDVNGFTACSYHNVGAAYGEQQEYSIAIEYFSKSLEIFRKIYGDNHPDVASELSSLGYVYFLQDNYTKTLEYYTKSLNIRQYIYGADNIEVANSYLDIGVVYAKSSNYTEALEYYNRALKIFKANLCGEADIIDAVQQEIALVREKITDDKWYKKIFKRK